MAAFEPNGSDLVERPIRGGGEIPALTGLRGVAALSVLFYHFAYLQLPDQVGFHVIPGYLAVDLFFVLSGFLMALAYARYFTNGYSVGTHYTFLRRRFARVYPVYFVVTVAFLVLQKLHLWPGIVFTKSLPANVLLIQSWGVGLLNEEAGKSIVGQAWSISVEAFAYLAFPVLLWCAAFGRMRRSIATAVACGFGLVLVASHPGVRGPLDLTHHSYDLRPLLRCVCEFSLGLVAWTIWSRPAGASRLPSWTDAAAAVSIAALLFVPNSDVVIVALLPVLVVGLTKTNGVLSRFLSTRAPHRLGEISYSLYLIAGPIQRLLPGWIEWARSLGLPAADLLAPAAMLAVDLMAAEVLYRAIEKPAREWFRIKRSGEPLPPIDAEPAAP